MTTRWGALLLARRGAQLSLPGHKTLFNCCLVSFAFRGKIPLFTIFQIKKFYLVSITFITLALKKVQ